MGDRGDEVEPQGKPFRVLALDGGGIMGAYTAAVLAGLERMTGKRVVDHFDLITGTSTGGLIAVALGMQVPACQILDFYVEKGPQIFPSAAPGWRGAIREHWRHLRGPKHSHVVLRREIEAVLGGRKFGESKCRLVIPAYDGVSGAIQLFKTAHTADYKQDYLLPATTVAMGTSAAPTYFPAYAEAGGGTFLDGGVWANCPAMVGLLEATCVLGRRAEEVELLSIGTTTEPFEVAHRRRRGGLLSWNRGLVDLLMRAQVDASLGQAGLITRGRMLRIDAVTRPGRFSLDNAREIPDLRALGDQAARQHEKQVSRRFLGPAAEPFEPVYRVDVAATGTEPGRSAGATPGGTGAGSA